MNRRSRLLGLMVVVALLAGLPALGAAQGTSQPGVSGTTYTSPTYGYTLSWDKSWQVANATSQNRTDTLDLSNKVSYVEIRGYPANGTDVKTCLQGAVTTFQNDPSASNFRQAQDASGKPLGGGNARDVWANYEFTYTTSSGASDLMVSLECHDLPPQGMLFVSQAVPASDLEVQSFALSGLLKSLQLPGGASAGAPTVPAVAATAATGPNLPFSLPTPTATLAPPPAPTQAGGIFGLPTPFAPGPAPAPATAPAAATAGTSGQQAGVNGRHYTSPTYGYQLAWGTIWSVAGASSQGGVDSLELNDGTSDITFRGTPANGQDAQACLADASNLLRTTTGFSNVTQSQDTNGKPLAGGDASDAWSVYDFTYTAQDGSKSSVTAYLECYAMPSVRGLLRISQFVSGDKYNDEIQARSTLLDSLKLPGGTTPAGTASAGTAAPSSATAPGFFLPPPSNAPTATPTRAANAPAQPTIPGFFLPGPAGTTPPAASPTQGGTTGTTYTNPTYHYTVKWDTTWQLKHSPASNNPSLELSNGVSDVAFLPWPIRDAQQCLTAYAPLYVKDSGFSNSQIATDSQGKQLRGGDSSIAYVVFTAQGKTAGTRALFFACITLAPQNASLIIRQDVSPSDYNSQVDARNALIDQIVLPPGSTALAASSGTAPAPASAPASAPSPTATPIFPFGG